MSSTPENTRTRILNAAWTLLESGEAKTRMSDFAKRAGISRQALYLHFPSRAELLIALTRHVDAVKGIDDRLAASRAATTGRDRLDAFVAAWGNYIPDIYGVGRALMAMQDSDPEAAAAWDNRMQAVREGCAAAVAALQADGALTPDLTPEQATDLLWTLLSVRGWEQLVRACGWPQDRYVTVMTETARRALMAGA